MDESLILRSPFPDIEIPRDRSLPDFVLQKALTYGDRIAFIDDVRDRTVTYSVFVRDCYRLAAGLYNHGLTKGDVVAISMPNSAQYAAIFHAVILCGGMVSAIVPEWLNDDSIVHIMKNSNPKYIFAATDVGNILQVIARVHSPAFQGVVIIDEDTEATLTYASLLDNNFDPPNVPVNISTDGVCLTYTSGTTGEKKGVVTTHQSYIITVLRSTSNPELSMIDVEGHYTTIMNRPLTYGQMVYLTSGLYSGLTCVTIADDYDVNCILTAVEKHKVNFLTMTPLPVAQMVKYKDVCQHDTSSLKRVLSGSAPQSQAIYNKFREIYKVEDFVQGYGTTETLVLTATPKSYFGTSVGQLLQNVQVKIIDVNTQESLGSGGQGEIWVKTPALFTEYRNLPERRAEALEDGCWFKTGDIGYYDDDGFLYVIDRLKEMMDYDAVKIPPVEIEAVLLNHPDISEVCVVGYPDEQYGELPRAYIVKKPGSKLTEEDVNNLVLDHLMDSRRLRGGVIFVDDLPKNALDKVMKKLVKQQMLEEYNKSKMDD